MQRDPTITIIAETIDGVPMRLTENGTLEIGDATFDPTATLTLRLFLLRPDVDTILNLLEIAADSRQTTSEFFTIEVLTRSIRPCKKDALRPRCLHRNQKPIRAGSGSTKTT